MLMMSRNMSRTNRIDMKPPRRATRAVAAPAPCISARGGQKRGTRGQHEGQGLRPEISYLGNKPGLRPAAAHCVLQQSDWFKFLNAVLVGNSGVPYSGSRRSSCRTSDGDG